MTLCRPSSLDALVFGHVAAAAQNDTMLPWLEKYPLLVEHHQRFLKQYFPDVAAGVGYLLTQVRSHVVCVPSCGCDDACRAATVQGLNAFESEDVVTRLQQRKKKTDGARASPLVVASRTIDDVCLCVQLRVPTTLQPGALSSCGDTASSPPEDCCS
jgi:hypothetical protein